MPCSEGTYTISTTDTHSPTWSGTLSIAADGTATFTPTGGSSVTVTPECGTDHEGAWIQFTNHSATPAVHYKKAHWVAANDDYEGPCDNDPREDVDDWTAAALNRLPRPGETGKRAGTRKAAKKTPPKKKAKKVVKKAVPKKVGGKKAAGKAAKKAAPKRPAKRAMRKKR